MPRVFLIHGWTTSPQEDWFPWAENELTKIGYQVLAPELPDTHHPIIADWVAALKVVVGEIKPTDIFIGHSLGCLAILQFLQSEPANKKVDKVIFIAGFVRLTEAALDNPTEDFQIIGPWYKSPIDYQKVKGMANYFTAVFSDDDPWVDYEENGLFFESKLGAKTILLKNHGHFMAKIGGITELPIILKLVG